MSRGAFRVRSCFWLFALLLVGAGCRLPKSDAPGLRGVVVRPAPEPLRNDSLPVVENVRVERALVPSEAKRLTTGAETRFAEAREAFWNHDTAGALRLLRESLSGEENSRKRRHLQWLIVDCLEADADWDGAFAALTGFGLAELRRDHAAHLQFMASLPAATRSWTESLPLPMELRLGQLVVTRVRINGVDARVFVDTGFSMSLVTESFADRAGLKVFRQTVTLSDANDRDKDARIALANEVRFGGLLAKNVPLVCSSLNSLRRIVGDVDAVVGWDLLQHADVLWDFPARQMTIAAPPPASTPERLDLSGRRLPLLRVTSSDGHPLDLFLDTGFALSPAGISLTRNAGLLDTRVDLAGARWNWRPSFQLGLNSFRVRWKRRLRPFEFWFAGRSFGLAEAKIANRVDVREGRQTCDGVIGNAPFLSGQLRLCGVRRLAGFVPPPDR